VLGRQSNGPLVPVAPLLVADPVVVLDPRGLARIEREVAVVVLEAQPQLLERVPVVADIPGHRMLAIVQRLELQLVPRQRVLGVRLLSDIRAAFGTDGRLATAALLERLAAVDDAPWCEQLDGRSDTRGSWLARKLKPYGISPRAVRIGADHPRGYDAQDVADAWRRYLHEPSPT
jgi:hypothetical protein